MEEQRNLGRLVLLPTGAGESRPLGTEGLKCAEPVLWFPDGKRALVTCRSPAPRAYLLDVDGGKPRPLTPEGTSCTAISPDGREAACVDLTQKWLVYPTESGPPRSLPGIGDRELVIQWSADGRSLFVRGSPDLPQEVFRLDLASGRRQLWKTIGPSDPAGVYKIDPAITPDGRSYAYVYNRRISDLWLVDGLR